MTEIEPQVFEILDPVFKNLIFVRLRDLDDIFLHEGMFFLSGIIVPHHPI